MCCFVETNAIFERYSGVLVSDDFAEIAKVFGQRVAMQPRRLFRKTREPVRKSARMRNSQQIVVSPFPMRIPSRTRWLSSRAAFSGLSSATPITSLCCVPAASARRPMREAVPAAAFLCTTGERPPFIARIFSVSWRKSAFPNAQKGLEKAKEMHAQEKKPTKERGDAR